MPSDVVGRIADRLTEILQDKDLTWNGLQRGIDEGAGNTNGSSIARIRARKDYRLSTLIKVLDFLGYDLVIHFRERAS